MRRLALVLMCLPLLLQTTTAQEAETPAEEAVTEESSAATIEEAPVISDEEPLTQPGNYQASEQISDDLSVSFPVDI